eukprot:1865579-Rhodomonas_salina.1
MLTWNRWWFSCWIAGRRPCDGALGASDAEVDVLGDAVGDEAEEDHQEDTHAVDRHLPRHATPGASAHTRICANQGTSAVLDHAMQTGGLPYGTCTRSREPKDDDDDASEKQDEEQEVVVVEEEMKDGDGHDDNENMQEEEEEDGHAYEDHE